MKKRMLISGGNGLLAQEIIKQNTSFDIISLAKDVMNVINREQILFHVLYHKPDIFLHCAALTHPMEYHKSHPEESIDANIVGTANVAQVCLSEGVKMAYISTDWVYPNKKHNTEKDALLPSTAYGWSKLGGECAVHLLPDHLIMRSSFTARPYKFDEALVDVYKSYLYADEAAGLMLKLIETECTGIYNVCGETRTAYQFAQESKPDIGTTSRKDVGEWIPDKCTMSNKKLINAQKKWLKKG